MQQTKTRPEIVTTLFGGVGLNFTHAHSDCINVNSCGFFLFLEAEQSCVSKNTKAFTSTRL